MGDKNAMTSLSGKRLVVFGCGYVGTAVAVAALGRGMTVTALTRNAVTAAALRSKGIETVVADLASRDWHGKIPPNPEFVLNCVSSGGGGLEAYRRSYVEGTRSMLEWAKRGGTMGTLVYTSSTSVYPQGDGVIVDESAPTPSSSASDRARLLLQAEDEIRAAVGVCHRWFLLRLAGIYGPGRRHLVDQVRSGEVAGTGERHLNLVHCDDIVGAIMACCTAPSLVASDVFNVVDDVPTPKADVVAWLAAEMGVPVPSFTGEPISAGRGNTPDRIISNTKIKARLKWSPRHPTFRDGYGSGMLRGT